MKDRKIIVLMGGPSKEAEVSRRMERCYCGSTRK